MNYLEADKLLTGRCKESRKIENNTYLKRKGDNIVVRLYETDIITFKPDGTEILNSGGYKTPTTKDRLNHFSNSHIKQQNSIWFIGDVIFFDGITIKNGKPIGKCKTLKGLKQIDKEKKEAKKYAELCTSKFPIEKPSGGDCWYCHMVTDSGRPLGEVSKDRSHILSHFKEKYVVPSLVYKACKDYPISGLAGDLLVNGTDYGNITEVLIKQIQKSIYRFCLKQLNYAI